MIKYRSTRNQDKKIYTFSEVLLRGIASDGGLLVPDKFPSFSLEQLRALIDTSYQEKAVFILKLFETDFLDEISRLTEVSLPGAIPDLLRKPVRFQQVRSADKAAIEKLILQSDDYF